MNKVLSTWFNRYLSSPEAITLVLFFIAAVAIFKIMGQILGPIILSAIFSFLLFGIVNKLRRWRLPHWFAVSVVFLLFIGVLLLLFLRLFPFLWEEMEKLTAEVPVLFGHVQVLLASLPERFPDLISVEQSQHIIAQFATYLANFSREVLAFSLTSLFGVATVAVYLVLVPLLVFFFLRDGEDIARWFKQFLPKKRKRLDDICDELNVKIVSYVRGKIIEILIVAALTIVAFLILKLRYAVLLGALVGFSVLVPYVGIVVATIPVVVVGSVQWGWSEHFFYIMLVHTIITILDANVLVPLLFAEVLSLHPLAIILSVLIFGNLFGFWGIFFAIPLVSLFNVLLKMWPKENI